MKKQLVNIFGVLLAIIVVTSVNAADGDTGVLSTQFGSTGYSYTTGFGSVFGTVSVEGNGNNRPLI